MLLTRTLHPSLRQVDSQPQQFRDRLWNCSAPFWPDFRFHLICNRHKECTDGEDERDCPYALCEKGGKL